MAARATRRARAIHWIPPNSTAAYSITIERKNGTVDDVTELVHLIEIKDGATDVIGEFKFELWNPNETYTNVWTGMEIVRYYSDYAATATTLRFRGRAEKIAYSDNKVKVSGRSESLKFMDITVTKNYSVTETSVILKDLVDTYGTGFTYTNVATSTVSLTVNWYQKPFWECITELCTSAGFDCYVDSALDFHYYLSGSRVNTGEAIVHDYNLLEVDEFADDLSYVRNRIIVYGAEQDGVQVLYTAEDTTSINAYSAREEIVSNSNITNYQQAVDYGDYLLSTKKDPPQVGNVVGVLLATIQPGEMIRLSSPPDNLPPGNYRILNYEHKIDVNRGLTTTVSVNKEPKQFSDIMKSMVESDNTKQQTSLNPHEMRYAYNFLFDSDSGTHVSNETEIVDGVLKPKGASGTWISDGRTLASNLDEAYLVLVSETITDTTVYISGNNGVDWQEITQKEKITVSTAKGTTLKVKVVFSGSTPQIDSLAVLYKLE